MRGLFRRKAGATGDSLPAGIGRHSRISPRVQGRKGPMRIHLALAICGFCLLSSGPRSLAATAGFEDLSLSSGSYWSGATNGVGSFASSGILFRNDSFLSFGMYSWNGFAYSNVSNISDPAYTNQYASISGGGADGSATYAVGYDDGFTAGRDMVITFDVPTTVQGVYVNNTTYTGLTLRDGDPNGFAKKFGGDDGTDPDWFKVVFYAYDNAAQLTGTAEFYLADYRAATSQGDYIIQTWTPVNLASLGSNVKTLELALDSSDTGAWGINTPTYIALDQLQTIPEPGSAALWLTGLVAALWRRAWNHKRG